MFLFSEQEIVGWNSGNVVCFMAQVPKILLRSKASERAFKGYLNSGKRKTVRTSKPPWRNRLARSAVNRKVGGSSPPGGAYIFANVRNQTHNIFFVL